MHSSPAASALPDALHRSRGAEAALRLVDGSDGSRHCSFGGDVNSECAYLTALREDYFDGDVELGARGEVYVFSCSIGCRRSSITLSSLLATSLPAGTYCARCCSMQRNHILQNSYTTRAA